MTQVHRSMSLFDVNQRRRMFLVPLQSLSQVNEQAGHRKTFAFPSLEWAAPQDPQVLLVNDSSTTMMWVSGYFSATCCRRRAAWHAAYYRYIYLQASSLRRSDLISFAVLYMTLACSIFLCFQIIYHWMSLIPILLLINYVVSMYLKIVALRTLHQRYPISLL